MKYILSILFMVFIATPSHAIVIKMPSLLLLGKDIRFAEKSIHLKPTLTMKAPRDEHYITDAYGNTVSSIVLLIRNPFNDNTVGFVPNVIHISPVVKSDIDGSEVRVIITDTPGEGKKKQEIQAGLGMDLCVYFGDYSEFADIYRKLGL